MNIQGRVVEITSHMAINCMLHILHLFTCVFYIGVVHTCICMLGIDTVHCCMGVSNAHTVAQIMQAPSVNLLVRAETYGLAGNIVSVVCPPYG